MNQVDMAKLVQGGEVQDLVSGAIIKGIISARVSDDFVVDLGRKSEGILEKGEFDEPEGHWITLRDPEGNEFCLH